MHACAAVREINQRARSLEISRSSSVIQPANSAHSATTLTSGPVGPVRSGPVRGFITAARILPNKYKMKIDTQGVNIVSNITSYNKIEKINVQLENMGNQICYTVSCNVLSLQLAASCRKCTKFCQKKQLSISVFGKMEEVKQKQKYSKL